MVNDGAAQGERFAAGAALGAGVVFGRRV